MDHMKFLYPEVPIGSVPCPIDGCEVTMPILARLVIDARESDTADVRYRLDSIVNADSIELHAAEHGMDITTMQVDE